MKSVPEFIYKSCGSVGGAPSSAQGRAAMLVGGENALAQPGAEPVQTRRIQRIRGGASTTWQHVAIVGIAGMPIFICGLILLIVLRPVHLHSFWGGFLFFGFLYLFVLSGFLLALGISMMRVQASREAKRGYTPNAKTNVNAAQIDLRSGVIIREPGDPLLTNAERTEAVRRARAWAGRGR